VTLLRHKTIKELSGFPAIAHFVFSAAPATPPGGPKRISRQDTLEALPQLSTYSRTVSCLLKHSYILPSDKSKLFLGR
jgi:hypothetical protein